MIRKHFRIRRIVLGLAFAAIAVPVAQAKPVEWQVGSDQPISPAQISIHGGVTPTLAQLEAESQSATLQSSSHGGTTPTMVQLEAEALRYQARHSSQNPSAGFDWDDAGLGGSVVFAALLLLLTSVGAQQALPLASRRHRSGQHVRATQIRS